MNVSEALVDALDALGVEHAFGVFGGGIAFRYNHGPVGNAITDWTFAGAPALLAAESFHLSGAAAFSIAGIAQASADDFSIDITTAPAGATDGAAASPVSIGDNPRMFCRYMDA